MRQECTNLQASGKDAPYPRNVYLCNLWQNGLKPLRGNQVRELWVGTRGVEPGRSEKLVLVKKRSGVVEALNM